jgi:hypothetical protein
MNAPLKISKPTSHPTTRKFSSNNCLPILGEKRGDSFIFIQKDLTCANGAQNKNNWKS